LCGILFLSVLINSYAWSENKIIQKNRQTLKKEQLRKKKEPGEEFFKRIQGEVRKTLKEETYCNLIKSDFSRIDPDFLHRAPKDEKVIFTRDLRLEKKSLKTRLDVKLGKTRKVTQITEEVSFDKWKIQYHYNAQTKFHSFKGDAEIASFSAHVVINSKQKPAFSASRPIEITKSIKVVPSGNCNLENKNLGVGLTGSVNKSFTAAVFINSFPGVRKLEYSLKGSLHNILDIKLRGSSVCSSENPQQCRATHNGTLIKKLGKHVSLQAGFQYENSMITNPSFSFVYSRNF